MFFNSSLAPYTSRFACRAWRLGKASGCVTRGGTRVSIGVTWIDLANYDAWTISGCSETATPGSTKFYGGGKGGWLIVTRATVISSHRMADLATLDRTITNNCRNWRHGNMRENLRLCLVESRRNISSCLITNTSAPMIGEVTNCEVREWTWIHKNCRNQKLIPIDGTNYIL